MNQFFVRFFPSLIELLGSSRTILFVNFLYRSADRLSIRLPVRSAYISSH
ncbi:MULTISPECIES: hypothetical protein [Anaerotruncus]|nr:MULTISPECIES: hypothetical protein [Anaerotruncus]